ncbi:hypothetical protein B9Z19DRAFT_1063786 [Tuber borchii]|uniref:Uncharacterized protein n=1 Tax=Tuber borchii TaxID=42251 RepID=A0A2T6ZX09_TUBBO|nr:hypothetical protein B9Z19DRAFT_1063786 [Tuber borchii]
MLLGDIATKYNAALTRLLAEAQRVPTVAAPVTAPLVAPIAIRNNEYANMPSLSLAGPRSICLWLDKGSVRHPNNPVLPGFNKIQWQTQRHVYWMETTEPTIDNLFKCKNKVLSRGYTYYLLVGMTRQDLLLYGLRVRDHDGISSTGAIHLDTSDNRGPSPNALSDPVESDRDGNEPRPYAPATKRATGLSTKTAGNTMRMTGQSLHSGLAEINQPEPDSNDSAYRCHISYNRVMPDLESGFTPCPGKQPSAPPTDLRIRTLKSGRQIGRETVLKKASQLSSQMVVNSYGKSDLAVMTEDKEPNSSADTTEPSRNVACGEPVIDSSIEGKPDGLHGEINQSRQPTTRPCPPNTPPPLCSNPSDDLASTASEQRQVRTSAGHVLMLASGAQQPADTVVTLANPPSRCRSLSD